MAATNKCLARSNKPSMRAHATNKREHRQRAAISDAAQRLDPLRTVLPVFTALWRSTNGEKNEIRNHCPDLKFGCLGSLPNREATALTKLRPILGKFRKFVDRLIERPHQPSGSIAAYGLAVTCVAVAFFIRLQLGLLDHNASPFTMLYPAILFAALWGGVRAGMLAVVLGGTLSWWAFFDPRFTFVPPLTFGNRLFSDNLHLRLIDDRHRCRLLSKVSKVS